MNALETRIEIWQQRCDYAEGVALVEQYLKDDVIVRLLKSAENNFTRKKLDEAIKLLLQSHKADERTLDSETQAILDKLEEDRKLLFFRTCQLHGALTVVRSNDERKEVAKQILDNHVALKEAWAVHDYVMINGCLPPQDAGVSMVLADFMREYENLRINIVRAKGRLNKAESDMSKRKAESNLNFYENRFEQFEYIRLNGRIVV